MLSISKLVLQDAAEELQLADDQLVEPQLFDAFPKPMRKAHADAIRAHRLRNEIVATKVANRLVNRLGPGVAFDLTEEEGASLQQVDRRLPRRRAAARPRQAVGRDRGRRAARNGAHRAVLDRRRERPLASVRHPPRRRRRDAASSALCKLLEPGVRKISAAATKLIRSEVRNEAAARRDRLIALGASEDIVRGLVRLYELDGVFGIAALAARRKVDELALTRAYTRLGEALGLDWAQQQVARFVPADQWERLLTAGLARDFEQLRIEFLSRVPRQASPTTRSTNGSQRRARASTSSAS